VSATGCVLVGLARVAMTFAEVRDLGDVHRQARTDELTGLPNRRALYEQTERLLAEARPDAPVALLLLDLDRFKEINDSLGHAAGDELLVLVGRRARAALHGRGVVARLGGDEFAIVLPGTTEAAARDVAEEVRRALAGGFQVDTVTLHVDASIGIGLAESDTTRTELLRCADIAMYEAKTTQSGVMAYSGVDTTHSVDRLRTMQDLRLALRGDDDGGRLLVHLQPQTRLESGALIGVEALVRWQHPERGLLYPDAFLAAAETAALMGPLAETVLDLSLSACRDWWDAGHLVPVSVNLCAANVHDLTLPAKISTALARHALPARALVIELTEDSLMTDPARARAVLDQIRRLGTGVSIDDYGTGYSSLAYLRDLAVDELKIDRTFIANLAGSASAAAIVRHTVELGHALGLRLVAEGIEDQDSVQILTALGCDVAQGYHIARPMPAPELLTWMQRHDAPTLSLAGDP
jgi:diguanylate cyclase (GGDEF)-like protein